MSANGQTKAPANQYTEKIGLGEKIAYGCEDLASSPFIKLDKIYPQVMKELEEREQSGKL